jgi:hypothetical protein
MPAAALAMHTFSRKIFLQEILVLDADTCNSKDAAVQLVKHETIRRSIAIESVHNTINENQRTLVQQSINVTRRFAYSRHGFSTHVVRLPHESWAKMQLHHHGALVGERAGESSRR